MIPMACPSCGRGGNVPNDKLNTRLHCRKCETVFHVDMSGHVILGAPETDEHRSKRLAKDAAHARYDPIDDVVKRINRLPRFLRFGVMAAAGVAVVMLLLPLLGFLKPETPEQVSVRAAQALLTGDASTLRRLATPATSADVPSWLESRSVFFPGIAEGTRPATLIDATPVPRQRTETAARDEIMLSVLGDTPSSKSQLFVTFHIQLAKEGGAWKVDVTKTKSMRPTRIIKAGDPVKPIPNGPKFRADDPRDRG